MSSIEKKLELIISEILDKRDPQFSDKDFVQVINVIEEYKSLGISNKQEYDIPLPDTLGRSYYQN